MFVFLMIVHIFVSMVLIIVILMQAGRGGGLSEMFAGASTQTIFGTSAAKFLTRATAICAVLFLVTSLSLAVLSSKRSRSLMESGRVLPAEMEEKAKDAAQETAAPAQPAAPQDEKKPIESPSE